MAVGCCRSRLSSNSSRQRAASPRWVRASPISVSPGPTVTLAAATSAAGAAVPATTGREVIAPSVGVAGCSTGSAAGASATLGATFVPMGRMISAEATRRCGEQSDPVAQWRRSHGDGAGRVNLAGSAQLRQLVARLDSERNDEPGPQQATPRRRALRRRLPLRRASRRGHFPATDSRPAAPTRRGRRRPGAASRATLRSLRGGCASWIDAPGLHASGGHRARCGRHGSRPGSK